MGNEPKVSEVSIVNVDIGPLSFSIGSIAYGGDAFSVRSIGATGGLDIPFEATYTFGNSYNSPGEMKGWSLSGGAGLGVGADLIWGSAGIRGEGHIGLEAGIDAHVMYTSVRRVRGPGDGDVTPIQDAIDDLSEDFPNLPEKVIVEFIEGLPDRFPSISESLIWSPWDFIEDNDLDRLARLDSAAARYPLEDYYSGNDNNWRLPANDWRRSSRDDRDRAYRNRDDDDGPSGNSGGTDNSAPSGGKNGFFSGSNSYGNSSFDSGPKPGYSNPTNVSSPSTGEKVYDKGVYDLEGPEATGAGTYVQMRLAEGLPISRGTAA